MNRLGLGPASEQQLGVVSRTGEIPIAAAARRSTWDVGCGRGGDLRSAVSAGSETRAEQWGGRPAPNNGGGDPRRAWAQAREHGLETFGRRFRRGRRPAPSNGSETRAEQWGGGPRRAMGRRTAPRVERWLEVCLDAWGSLFLVPDKSVTVACPDLTLCGRFATKKSEPPPTVRCSRTVEHEACRTDVVAVLRRGPQCVGGLVNRQVGD